MSQPLISQRCNITIHTIAVTALCSFLLSQRCAHRCLTAVGSLLCRLQVVPIFWPNVSNWPKERRERVPIFLLEFNKLQKVHCECRCTPVFTISFLQLNKLKRKNRDCSYRDREVGGQPSPHYLEDYKEFEKVSCVPSNSESLMCPSNLKVALQSLS